MQRVIPLRLNEDSDLRATIESFRLVQEQVSSIAHEHGEKTSAVELHRLAYDKVKGTLKSQLTCTAIRTVASAYARSRKGRKRLYGPIHFSKPRALFLIGKAKRDACPPRRETIRVWTLNGRKNIRYSIPAQFADMLKQVKTFDALAVSIKKGRLVATLSVTLKSPERKGSLPAGLAIGKNKEVAVVDAAGKSIRVITVAQAVMEETARKTHKRLENRLAERKADGRETRSVRRALKRLSRRRHMRTRAFSHEAARCITDWLDVDAILVIEDLRPQPPSKRGRKVVHRPHYYESLRRRLEEKCASRGTPVSYVTVDRKMKRCSVCGAHGETTDGFFECGTCENHIPVGMNAAQNVRNKFTVTRPWTDVSQS